MKWLIAALVACVAIGGGAYLLMRDGAVKQVEVHAGDPIPTDLNRADDYGADTLRAYLAAALACDDAALARFGAPLEDLAGLCDAKPETVEAEVARDELDPNGRALWRVSASDTALPSDLHVWLTQKRGNEWSVDTGCRPLSRC